MFARYFVELPISPEEVERALSRDPRLGGSPGWPSGPTIEGTCSSPRWDSARPSGSRERLSSSSDDSVRIGSKIVFPLRWAASGGCGPLPITRRRPRGGTPPTRTHPARDERSVRSSFRHGRPGHRSRASLEGGRGDAQGLPRTGRRRDRWVREMHGAPAEPRRAAPLRSLEPTRANIPRWPSRSVLHSG